MTTIRREFDIVIALEYDASLEVMSPEEAEGAMLEWLHANVPSQHKDSVDIHVDCDDFFLRGKNN